MSLTYAELDKRANQLAYRLISLGVGPEVPVGVLMDRSLDLAVALLGIMRAGGAYVPMDPSYPPDRLALMVEDSEVGWHANAYMHGLCMAAYKLLLQSRCCAGAGAAEPGEGSRQGGCADQGTCAAGKSTATSRRCCECLGHLFLWSMRALD